MDEEELENALIGQNPMIEEQPVFNTQDQILGGLGLSGAAFASQTGRAPTLSPQGPLSAFAQQVRANDVARLNAQFRPPALIGSTPVGTTGVFQPPAVTSTGGPPAVTSTSGPPSTTSAGARPRSASDFDFRLNRAQPSRLARFGGPGALIYGVADVGTELLTGKGISERIGEGGGGAVGNLLFPGAESQPAFTEAELQRSRDNLSSAAQFDIMEEDAEFGVAPLTDFTPLELEAGALDKEIAKRQSNITDGKVQFAKEIRELGTVTDDQRAVQDFMDERAERAFEKPTDVITPFQEQAELTADLFTDPNTAIGQFVPRSTFTLPDGTIIQEDEGGNRREISAEQLRQFEQDMAGLGQAQQSKTFSQEETMDRLGGRTLSEYLNAPAGTPGVSGLRTDPQGRMIPNVGQFQPQPVTPQPVTPQAPADQLSAFEQASLDRQLGIGGTGSFEGDSVLRDAKLRANERQPGESQTERDTRVAQSRTQGSSAGGQLSQSDLRDLAQGSSKNASDSEKARALEIQQRYGLGEFKPRETELQKNFTQKRIDAMDAQLKQAGIVPSAPPVVDPETGVITQEYSDGTIRFKGVGRSPSGGDINLGGFVSGDEDDKSSDFNKGEIREQDGVRYQFDGKKWNQI